MGPTNLWKTDFSLLKIESPLMLKLELSFHFPRYLNLFFWNFSSMKIWWKCDKSQINTKELLVMLFSLLDLFMKMTGFGILSNLVDDLKLNGMMMMIDFLLLWHLHRNVIGDQHEWIFKRLTSFLDWPNGDQILLCNPSDIKRIDFDSPDKHCKIIFDPGDKLTRLTLTPSSTTHFHSALKITMLNNNILNNV